MKCILCLRSVELFFTLPASRAFPVFRKVLKRSTIVFRRIIDIAADRTDISAGRRLECYLSHRNRLRRIVQVNDRPGFRVLAETAVKPARFFQIRTLSAAYLAAPYAASSRIFEVWMIRSGKYFRMIILYSSLFRTAFPETDISPASSLSGISS